jgi:uncharacterized protein (DUF305 family)
VNDGVIVRWNHETLYLTVMASFTLDIFIPISGEVMKFPKVLLTALAFACAASFSPAFAQTAAGSASMAGMNMSAGQQEKGNSTSTSAFQAADHSMMTGMSDVQYTGNADRDFVAHMIPHHQGAVAMAKVELKYGKDEKLRALARQIIASQNKEITFMKQWLATHSPEN